MHRLKFWLGKAWEVIQSRAPSRGGSLGEPYKLGPSVGPSRGWLHRCVHLVKIHPAAHLGPAHFSVCAICFKQKFTPSGSWMCRTENTESVCMFHSHASPLLPPSKMPCPKKLPLLQRLGSVGAGRRVPHGPRSLTHDRCLGWQLAHSLTIS